jgi:hypothetical protein
MTPGEAKEAFDMTGQQLLLVSIIVIIVAAALVLLRRRKTQRLNTRFGTEYSRVVDETGSRRKGEAGLEAREKRLDAIAIRPLSAADRDRYTASWRAVQAEFVDDPKYSVSHADHLLGELMSVRGYPVADFEQRAADLSVDHPLIVENYRSVHEIAVRHEQGQATTEELRRAMILYRSLFDELIGEPAGGPVAGSGVASPRAA